MNITKQKTRQMTRREALEWLAQATVVGCVACGTCSDAFAGDKEKKKKNKEQEEEEEGELKNIANLMSLPSGKVIEIEDPPLLLVRTKKGIAALSNICTHKRQELAITPDGKMIVCPRHASQFDLEGVPTGGQASKTLARFYVEVNEDGDIFVQSNRTVKSDTWAPLPTWAQPKSKTKAKAQ